MMKKILAVAIASAFAAPAFAATANVDVYGKLHASVNFYNDQPAAINDMGISSNASRIGFKGTEDLGGGLSGIWQIESGLNMDEQNGSLATRNSFVGLKGGFGTVLLGNHDTPLKLVGRKVDLFGDTQADSRNVMGGGSDTRAQNVAVYMSPAMSGFQITAAYSTDLNNFTAAPYTGSGNGGDDADAAVYNLSATYTNGPLFVGVGYGDGDGHEILDLGAHMRVAAGFNFGDFRIVGQYDKLNGNLSTDPDYDAWMVGAAYKMGAITLKANYMDGDKDFTTLDPKQFTIGADYALSKRTSAYVLYADGEYVTLGAGGGNSDRVAAVTATGGDISVISLGVVHNF
jgi:predicted porin